MEPLIIQLSLMIFYLSCVRAMQSKNFDSKLEFYNKVSIYEPLESNAAGSILSCSVLCGYGCNCFNFNLHTGMCLLYNSCNPSHLTVLESGWRFFTDPSIEPIENGKIGFVVLFMRKVADTTKDIYIASKEGGDINMTTSLLLDQSLKHHIDRTVNIPSSQHVSFPSEIELDRYKKEVKSVFIEAYGDAYVVGLEINKWSAESTAFLPLHKLSTRYVVISTEPSSSVYDWNSQFALAGIKSNTSISITFKMKRNIPLYIDGKSFGNGDIYNFTLDRFETYQIAHKTDLTGTVIKSSKPIAVFSGNDCNQLENIVYCDPLSEQLIPITKIDSTYIVPPNLNYRKTKILITAVEKSNISYTVDETTQSVTLNKLDSFDIKISTRQTCVLESNTPIIVTSFGLSYEYSDMGDPYMTFVPGLNQYIEYYKTVMPSGFSYNYVTVIMQRSLKDSIRINHASVIGGSILFEENVSVKNITYNVRSIYMHEGELTVSTVGGERFGLVLSAVRDFAAYGFSGIHL